MIKIKSEEIIINQKYEKEVYSEKRQKTYKFKILVLIDKENIVTEIIVNDRLFNKAEENKKYILKYILNTNGKIELNDIELIK